MVTKKLSTFCPLGASEFITTGYLSYARGFENAKNIHNHPGLAVLFCRKKRGAVREASDGRADADAGYSESN